MCARSKRCESENVYGASVVELASHEEVKALLNCEVGSLGPINVTGDIEIIADQHQLLTDVQERMKKGSIM